MHGIVAASETSAILDGGGRRIMKKVKEKGRNVKEKDERGKIK
jgi:hypothetical protein